jgi:organic radical activating enzyme
MFGSNPKRKPIINDGNILQVQEIFPTMQGEGFFAGQAAIFIRLGGCNLACSFCDTEFESFNGMSIDHIINQAQKLSHNHIKPFVVITGGEPMRQNILPLCEKLINLGFTIQIETNGTLFQELPKEVHIICSPKAVGDKYYALRPDVLERVNALKFIISANLPPYNIVPNVGQTKRSNLPIYLQPMDEYCEKKNSLNIAHTIRLAKETDCNISLQLHKMLDIA